MTSFYQQQELARQKSSWLVVYFIIAVVLVAGLTTMAIAIVLLNSKIIFSHKISTQEFPVSALAICFGITATIIGLTSWARMKRLKSGGGAFIAAHLGGRRLSRETASPQEKVLLNVVEEMAIASGCRVPQVFVLDHEQSINAFAAGFDIHTCVIGVTQGLLDQMNRDELQGVIGHEFSHILNGDMKLNLQLTGWLAGILVISEIGLVLMRSTSRSNSRRNKDGGAQIILGIVLWVIGSIGLLAAKIIKAGFSKQREYLADASAVQFTRNPLG
ncbi:MAG: M48 family metalloprotease, partial [Pseudobdellovibrionaceae bacterium]